MSIEITKLGTVPDAVKYKAYGTCDKCGTEVVADLKDTVRDMRHRQFGHGVPCPLCDDLISLKLKAIA